MDGKYKVLESSQNTNSLQSDINSKEFSQEASMSGKSFHGEEESLKKYLVKVLLKKRSVKSVHDEEIKKRAYKTRFPDSDSLRSFYINELGSKLYTILSTKAPIPSSLKERLDNILGVSEIQEVKKRIPWKQQVIPFGQKLTSSKFPLQIISKFNINLLVSLFKYVKNFSECIKILHDFGNPAPTVEQFTNIIYKALGVKKTRALIKEGTFSAKDRRLWIELFQETNSKTQVRHILKKKNMGVPPLIILSRFIDQYNIGENPWRLRYTIKNMNEIATYLGILHTGLPGKCLSTTFKKRLKWECGLGHNWNADAQQLIHAQSWCPKCRGDGEEIFARYLLSHLFKKKAIKHHTPVWLKSWNPITGATKGQMHLDGYVRLIIFGEVIEVALEYDEDHHFIRNLAYHPEEGDFKWGLTRDRQKDELCKKNKVLLIRVPYHLFPTRINKYLSNDIGIQQRIIETFLELLERKYQEDGKPKDVIKDRINKLRLELEKRRELSLKEYINNELKNLGTQLTIDDFFDSMIN